jgi:hypothetical protein
MNKSKGYKGHMNQLPNFIKYGMSQERWLTPTTTDIVRSPEGMEKRKQYRESIGRKYVEGCLSEQVDNQQNWPTPRAGNPGSRKPGTGGKILAEEAKIHAGPPAPEKSSTSGKNQGSPKLNPNWVEALMLGRGMTGWTQLPTEWIDSDF